MNLKNFIEGLQIIAKYENAPYVLRADHDQIWVSSLDKGMTEEDKKRVLSLGWEEDEDVDGWLAEV